MSNENPQAVDAMEEAADVQTGSADAVQASEVNAESTAATESSTPATEQEQEEPAPAPAEESAVAAAPPVVADEPAAAEPVSGLPRWGVKRQGNVEVIVEAADEAGAVAAYDADRGITGSQYAPVVARADDDRPLGPV